MRIPGSLSRARFLVTAFTVTVWLLMAGNLLAAGRGQSDAKPEANLPYLFGVYTVTWIAFFAYAFYMTRRQRDLRREIDELRRTLEERKP